MKNTENVNLLQPLTSETWREWWEVRELAPVFSKESIKDGSILSLIANGRPGCHGKWTYTADEVIEYDTYEFSVKYMAEDIENESISIYAMITWGNSDGKMLRRDYAEKTGYKSSDWRLITRVMEAPAEATKVTIELAFRHSIKGSVKWKSPQLIQRPPQPPRTVRIAAPLIENRGLTQYSREINEQYTLELIDRTAKLNPDIICLNERIMDEGLDSLPLSRKAETIPGRLTGLLGEKARLYNSYIILSMSELDGHDFYHTAVLIDREGEIAGKYRKVHLPFYESEEGFAPGNEYPVFDTDFGRIGLLICWDQVFSEPFRILRLKGAEIVFIPTQGDADIQTQARALDNGIYIVVSGIYKDTSSRIINPEGDLVAFASEEANRIAFAEIDLSKRYYKHWLSLGPGEAERRIVCINERRPDTYSMLQKDL